MVLTRSADANTSGRTTGEASTGNRGNNNMQRTPNYGSRGGNQNRPLASPNNHNLGVNPLHDGIGATGEIQNRGDGPPQSELLPVGNVRRSLELPPVLTPHAAAGNAGTPGAGQVPSAFTVPPPAYGQPPITQPAHGLITGTMPRVRVDPSTQASGAGTPASQDPSQPRRDNYAAYGDHSFPPGGNANAHMGYGRPPPAYTQRSQQPSPTPVDLMNLMIQENQRRDAMFERVIQSLAQGGYAQSPNQQAMCYQVMPDLSKHIESYDGEGGGSKAREWIRTLNGMRTLHHWPDSIALETARMHLTGGAKSWYRMHSNEFNTWNAFQTEFRQTFTTYESHTARWQRMIGRIQQKGEATQTYYHAKIHLCSELGLGVRDTKEQVLVGLWSKDVCSTMAAREHHNLADLYHDIVSYEQLEEQRISRIRGGYAANTTKAKPTSPTKPSTQEAAPATAAATAPAKNPDTRLPVKNEAGEFKCYNCNNYGHLSRECPEPKRPLICKNCQQTGHTQRHCTVPTSSTSGAVQQIDGPQPNAVAKYLKTATVNGRTLRAFVDPGSSECTVTAMTVLREGFTMEPELTELRSFGPDHYKVISPGIVRAEVTLDDVTVRDVAMRIVPDDSQSTPILVGRTFTDAPNVNYHKVGGQLVFMVAESDPLNHLEATEERTTQVDAAEAVEVPPHSVNFVRVVNPGGEWTLPVFNPGDRQLSIEKGRTVVRGELADVPVRVQQPLRSPIRREDLIVGPNRPEAEIEDLLGVVNEFRDCVSTDISDLGCTDLIEMDIVEKPNSRPVYSKPYKASNSEREKIKEIVDEWKREGIVIETHSPYASPVLLVKKKTGESRLVVDFRRLNQQTERMNFPLPDIDDHIARIGDARLFITLDLAHGYLQVPLTKAARAKTAFITPDDTGEFTRMSFGLMNAPFYFSKLMQRVLGPLREDSILFYLDDVLIPGKDWSELRERLIKALEALRRAGLTLKLPKCQFAMERITYLGYIISKDGIEPGTDKLQGIVEFPRPTDVHGIRRFLGLTGFFRRFVPRFAERAEPLSRLLKKGQEFVWGENEERAFLDLKGALAESPVLQMYDPRRRTELHTDASAVGLAAMLMQADDADQLRLVYAISRRTNAAERNYHSSKLELLAIIWAIARLRPLIVNLHFKIVTDCQALVYLCANKTKKPQIVRWYTQLGEYNFDIEHRAGERMGHVDALSRAPVDSPNDATELSEIADAVYTIVSIDDEIRMYQSADEKLNRKCEILRKPVRERNAHEKAEVRDYELSNGLLFKRDHERALFVIPRAMRKSLAVKFHDLQSHMGTDRTLAKMREKYFFPGMRAYVKRHIRACLQCVLTKALTGKQAGLMHPIVPGKRPFETVNIDHEGPFVSSTRGNKYILAIVDNLTKYVVMRAVRDTTTRAAMRVLDEFVLDFGAPRRIISDRGTCFTSGRFAEFCSQHGIEHVLNSPRHAQANGQIERMNRTILPAVQASVTHPDGRDWDARIRTIQRDLNEAPNKSTGISPFKALYGYSASHDEGPLRRSIPDGENEYRLPEEVQRDVRESIEQAQQRSKDRYDRGRREVKYAVGDIVYMKTVPVSTGESTKLQRRFRGPLVVTKILRGDTYGVVDLNPADDKRRYAATAHASQIKLWVPDEDEGPDNENEGSDDLDDDSDDAERDEGGTRRSNDIESDHESGHEGRIDPMDGVDSGEHADGNYVGDRPEDDHRKDDTGVPPAGEPAETEQDVPRTTAAGVEGRPKRDRRLPQHLRDYVLDQTLEDER